MNHSYWRWYLVGSLGLFALLLVWGNWRTWSGAAVTTSHTHVQVQVGQASILAEVVSTPAEQAKGLSGRVNLAKNSGMWFPFASGRAPAFWMRDMLIPIDIIWVRQGQVVSVSAQVPPPPFGTALKDLPLYTAAEPADAVLEVNAGWAKINGVGPGTSVSVRPAL